MDGSTKELSLKKKTSSTFLLYLIARGTMSNLGFTSDIDSAQLSGICFNKVIEKIAERADGRNKNVNF